MQKFDILYSGASVVNIDLLPIKLSYARGNETRIVALLQLNDGAINCKINFDILLLLLGFLSYRGIDLH